MFLHPQHFQQAERHAEEQLRQRLAAMHGHAYGLCELVIDENALGRGELVVRRCTGVLPCGLPVDIGGLDEPPPAREVAASLPAGKASVGVSLSVPLVGKGRLSVSADGTAGGRPTRYRQKRVPIHDETLAANEREIAVATRQFKLLLDDEPVDDFEKPLKIGEVERSTGNKLALRSQYVPPSLWLSASPQLLEWLRRIHGILSVKSEELATRRRMRGRGLVEFTSSEAASFWFLHTVNAHLPAMAHLVDAGRNHPEKAYLQLARLAGELFTFADEGHPREIAAYRHDDLGGTFGALEQQIRNLLGTVIPTRCTPIPLERTRESLFSGRIHDDRLLQGAQLYFAVMANVPEQKIATEIPKKAKVSSIEKLEHLIAQALRGLAVRHLPTPPAEIPVQPGRVYFQLDLLGEHWEAVRNSRSISFYVPPEFTGLKLELMAVKE